MNHPDSCRCRRCETTHAWTPSGDIAPCGVFMSSFSGNAKFINCKACLRLGGQMTLPAVA